MSSAFGGSAEHAVFAPPILLAPDKEDGRPGLCISQTTAILQCLGRRHGYCPTVTSAHQTRIELQQTNPQKFEEIRGDEQLRVPLARPVCSG